MQDCVLSGKFGSFLPYCYSDLGLDALVGAVDTSDFGPYYNKGLFRLGRCPSSVCLLCRAGVAFRARVSCVSCLRTWACAYGEGEQGGARVLQTRQTRWEHMGRTDAGPPCRGVFKTNIGRVDADSLAISMRTDFFPRCLWPTPDATMRCGLLRRREFRTALC